MRYFALLRGVNVGQTKRIEMKKLNPASTMLILLNFSASSFYGIIWFTVPLVIAH